MKDPEYTYDWYRELLENIRNEGLDFGRFEATSRDNTVLLRHDVDLFPEKALRRAEIEANLGVSSTYFFLLTSPLYNLLSSENRSILRQIQELGHKVGLHFSTHQYWSSEPEADAVRDMVRTERNILSQLAIDPVDIVSFHIPPEWVLRQSFEGFTNTYERRFMDGMTYRSDSSGRWHGERPFVDGFPNRIQLLTHPGLWGTDDMAFKQRVLEAQDAAVSIIKQTVNEQYLE
jgi:peptidoglycan/xylan/chitin deacetylase (PgdA/CDA1 family)